MRKVRMWFLAVLVAVMLWVVWLSMSAALASRTPTISAVLYVGQGSYSVVGSPTISASFIDRVLLAYHSPAAGLGSVIYAQGERYDIDPVYALAFFQHESAFGTTGEARLTLSPGNERCVADRPCIDRDRGGYAQMRSWADGFEHWYQLILYGYVQGQVTLPLVGHVCTTLSTIIPVYAPSRDGNDEVAYLAAVEHAVDTWHSGQVWT